MSPSPVSRATQNRTAPQDYFMKSARIGFRCWSLDDLPLARELWADIEVTRFLGGPFPDEEIGQRLEREIARMDAYQFQYWPIYLLSSGEHVGCCGLRPYRPEEQIPELGFHLRPRYWGQGLASEAARTVIHYAFDTIGAKGLSAGHHPDNITSKNLLEKLGFKYTHDEFYAPLQMNLPYYLLTGPE
jgi:[ribosomal protein S5]-alanine N-acetyltransferase